LADGPVADTGRWVAGNARWLRIAAGVLGAIVLLWGNEVSPARLFWSLVLTVVLLAVVQFMVGAGHGTSTSSLVPATATGDERDTVSDAVGPPGGRPWPSPTHDQRCQALPLWLRASRLRHARRSTQ
jgi:hypothetical protein